MPDDLDVLACRVEHLEHALVRHQFVERRQIQILGKRIDDDGLVRGRHLGDAEQGIVGGLTQKLGVDGNEGVA